MGDTTDTTCLAEGYEELKKRFTQYSKSLSELTLEQLDILPPLKKLTS